ncbi:stealth conserved region 3 domain-containing protein [Streptomyces chromofuscus]|uniref:Stealth conserved region 3 domain-containing protein n=1 Tax=Streptomyces chromofuscus TaxID=42881 RepID=A0A7M2T0D7_STRCW|nr:stealth conserved region 3 domain-containing protein [Streptomyces chromofuscus]QOV41619.1 stealth conserved region 3 domain-containing protein [Streptomyces chromofuscus]GGT44731.1 exopolysaccharide phosphotransferase [Streptomyces chromofuscus]
MDIRHRLAALPGLRAARNLVLRLGLWLSARLWALSASRARRRLRAAVPGLRRVTCGPARLYGRTVTGYTAANAAATDLEQVCALMDAAGVPYFLVPTGPGTGAPRQVIGVAEAHRGTVLAQAARHFAGTAGYVGAVGPDGAVTRAVLWADGRLPRALRRASVLRTGEVRLGPAGQVLGGLETGCDIEFWRHGRDLATDPGHLTVPGVQLPDVFPTALVAPRSNPVSEVLPVSAQRPAVAQGRGRTVPTFAPFAEPGVDEVCFPVDAVYTWVDGEDPAMAAKRRAHQTASDNVIAPRETGASRYTSHDELRYALRSLEMYAGFVRHVYLVTDSQVPAWLDPEAEGLTVVDHRDILPADALPVFNSHAIESRLHHIPGLSERYLYFNDDVFINRPVGAEHFFHGNGIARIPLSPLKLGVGDPHPMEPAPNSAGKNTREVIRRFHGRQITHKSLHTPHPQLLSVMREMESLGIEELQRTSYSRFRSITDVAPASTLHHHWAIATGRAVPADYRFRYVQLGTPDMRRRLARLEAGEDVDFFCLNDVDTAPADRAAAHAAIHAFLERKYPFASRFERTARSTTNPSRLTLPVN